MKMSYEEAMYFSQKMKQQALDKIEQKRKDAEHNARMLADTSSKTASSVISFGHAHRNSMADALRQVNPKKWR